MTPIEAVGLCLAVGGFVFGGGVLPLFLRYRRKQEEKRLEAFHQAVVPLLQQLTLGPLKDLPFKDLPPTDKQRFVRDSVRAASLGIFETERPLPDPNSVQWKGCQVQCTFCGLKMKCDSHGACVTCGLGARHWNSSGVS